MAQDLRIGLTRGGTATQIEGLVIKREFATTVMKVLRSAQAAFTPMTDGSLPYVYAGLLQMVDPALAPSGLQVEGTFPPC